MAVKRIVTPNKFIGLSTDTKPTMATDSRVRVGDTFYETNTFDMYVTRDGTNWSLKTQNVTVVDATGISAAMFGKPSLQWLNKGSAIWSKEHMIFSGWTAKLTGGYQSGHDDWSRVSFNVNSMPLSQLESILYAYRMTVTETVGPNISFDVHNPDAPNQWAEISYSNGAPGITKTSGWNYFNLLPASTAALFWFGDNILTSGITGNDGTTVATLATYQADAFFSTSVITKINIEWGYHSTTYLEPVFIGKIEVNDIDITLEPSAEEQLDIVRDDTAKALTTIPTWTFGTPTLLASNQASASWYRGHQIDGTYQKGATGWLAALYVKPGADASSFAEVNIPVNELPVPEFTAAIWSYLLTVSGIPAVSMIIWLHDPADMDKRCEVTQRTDHADLEAAAGWNAHELNTDTAYLYYYGENVGSPGPCVSAGTDYKWNQYTVDSVFSTWTIYRISFCWGWYGDPMPEAFLADVKLNGELIPLGPADGKHQRTVLTTKTCASSGAIAADDVVSENGSSGTDWDFKMGGTGYITRAVIASATNAITPRGVLQLYTKPPTCTKNDNAASNGPVTADIPYLVGTVAFPAMSDDGTGHSYSVATPSTSGNLPLAFDTPMLYGVLITKDTATWGQALISISLSADMQD